MVSHGGRRHQRGARREERTYILVILLKNVLSNLCSEEKFVIAKQALLFPRRCAKASKAYDVINSQHRVVGWLGYGRNGLGCVVTRDVVTTGRRITKHFNRLFDKTTELALRQLLAIEVLAALPHGDQVVGIRVAEVRSVRCVIVIFALGPSLIRECFCFFNRNPFHSHASHQARNQCR